MVRVCFTVLALVVALPASAQQLTLDIRDGLVTMTATNVPVRQVLAEWARVGGTRVVGGDRIAGAPLTLSFEGLPEAKALDIVLRGAAGYMAAARPVPGAGRSIYDRILVLATSTPPAGGAAATAAGNRPAANRFGVPPAVEPPDQADLATDMPEVNEQPQGQVNPFANAFGQAAAGATPFGQPGAANPFGQAMPQQPQAFPQGGFFQPLQPAQVVPGAVGPSGFFSAPGSATPGMVLQPAQPVQPPGVRPRPQG
jgi:hypothetical protein